MKVTLNSGRHLNEVLYSYEKKISVWGFWIIEEKQRLWIILDNWYDNKKWKKSSYGNGLNVQLTIRYKNVHITSKTYQ